MYLKDTSEGYGYYGPPSHHKLEDEVVAQESLQILGSDSESGGREEGKSDALRCPQTRQARKSPWPKWRFRSLGKSSNWSVDFPARHLVLSGRVKSIRT